LSERGNFLREEGRGRGGRLAAFNTEEKKKGGALNVAKFDQTPLREVVRHEREKEQVRDYKREGTVKKD